MSSGLALSWGLTGVFTVCAGMYLARVRSAAIWPTRVAWSLHALMAVAMVAMTWPWGTHVAPIAYVLIFTACALYFAYVGLFTTRVRHAVYHSVMMASMVLMALVMSPSTASDAPAMGAMPGMTVAGDAGAATGSSPTATWVFLTCGAAAVFFVGAALRSFHVVVRGPRRPVANLLMAVGMGVSFAALVV